MQEFLFLFRGGEATEDMSPQEIQEHMQKWFVWIDAMTKAGQYARGEPLEKAGKVISGARKVLTDGPHPEAKEVVGGYMIVRAKDLGGAVQIAQGCPIYADGGSVEVRGLIPLDELKDRA